MTQRIIPNETDSVEPYPLKVWLVSDVLEIQQLVQTALERFQEMVSLTILTTSYVEKAPDTIAKEIPYVVFCDENILEELLQQIMGINKKV